MSKPTTHSRSRRRLLLAASLTALMALSASGPVAADGPSRHGAAERLGHRLLNCTRTGGWVRADGSCKGRGSGRFSARVPALRLRDGISDHVAFPWSAELVTARVCAHSIDGLPEMASRFSMAGFRSGPLGENIGCSWGAGSIRDAVVRTHRLMQAEKPDRGGHWLNMKNRDFKSVGVGVASLNGMTTIVYDFYGR